MLYTASTSKLMFCSFSEEKYTEAWVLVVKKKLKERDGRCILKDKSLTVLFKSRSPWQP